MAGAAHDQRLLDTAVARGIIGVAQAREARERQRELEEQGDPRSIVEVLLAAGWIDDRLARMLDDRSLEGRRLGGFELISKIGAGSAGSVFRAKQTSLGRTVAVKVLDPAVAARPDLLERFKREARAAVRLDHPHMVQPVDCGEDGGLHYFAMELVDGGSAADRIVRGELFAEREALEVARSIALALEYIAGKGVVHRDIKPANILFTRAGAAKLADLGLALDREDDLRLTKSGVTVGTPAYISPEQVSGSRDVDIRSDLYSLGLSLFEMLTGAKPFRSGTSAQVFMKRLTEEIDDPRTIKPEISDATARLILKMAARDRTKRFASAAEAVAAIEMALAACPPGGSRRLAEGKGASPPLPDSSTASSMTVSSTAVAIRAPPAVEVTRPGGGSSSARRRRARGRPGPVVAGAVLLGVAAASFGAGYVVRGLRPDEVPAAPASARPAGTERGAGPPPDPSAQRTLQSEAHAVAELRTLLLSRRGDDGAYGAGEDLGPDPWTTGLALAALVLDREGVSPGHLRRLVDRLRAEDLGARADAGMSVEATAAVAVAFALARGRVRDREREIETALPHLGDRLLRAQDAEGSFGRIEGTAAAVQALAVLGAAEGAAGDSALTDALARAAVWLARTASIDDARAGEVALVLRDARDQLRRARRPTPAAIEGYLRAHEAAPARTAPRLEDLPLALANAPTREIATALMRANAARSARAEGLREPSLVALVRAR